MIQNGGHPPFYVHKCWELLRAIHSFKEIFVCNWQDQLITPVSHPNNGPCNSDHLEWGIITLNKLDTIFSHSLASDCQVPN